MQTVFVSGNKYVKALEVEHGGKKYAKFINVDVYTDYVFCENMGKENYLPVRDKKILLALIKNYIKKPSNLVTD